MNKSFISLNPSFYCPITGDVMTDPVIDRDGITYERSAIEDWIRKSGKSPVTRSTIFITDLIPNRSLRDAIEEEQQCATAYEAALEDIENKRPCIRCSGNYNPPSQRAILQSVTTDKPLPVPVGTDIKIRQLAKDGKLKHLMWLEASFDIRSILDIGDNDGFTALMFASQLGHMNVMSYLLDHGVDTNRSSNKFGYTALMLAAEFGQTDAVILLLERGSTINYATSVGKTALMCACVNGHVSTVDLLSERGASPNHNFG